MKERTEEILEIMVVALCLIGLISLVTIGVLSTNNETEETMQTHQWDVWSCDAPFGMYWVETSGGGCFLYYSTDSSLIFDATDPYFVVHLTDEKTMTLERYQYIYRDYWGNEDLRGPTTYHLYIPDPNTMEE